MKKFWILVHVFHGLVQEPEFFYTEKDAAKRKQELLKYYRSEYDEIEIFEKDIKFIN